MSHYIVMPNTEVAAEWGEFFNSSSSGLTANGYRVRIDGERLVFSAGAVDFMRRWNSADDGVVTEEAGKLVMWLAGDSYEVYRES